MYSGQYRKRISPAISDDQILITWFKKRVAEAHGQLLQCTMSHCGNGLTCGTEVTANLYTSLPFMKMGFVTALLVTTVAAPFSASVKWQCKCLRDRPSKLMRAFKS